MSKLVVRRILMLVSDMGTGGAERVAASLTDGWISNGIEVELIATYSRRVDGQIVVSRPAHFTRLADFPGCIGSGPLAYLRRLRRLRAIVRARKPELIISFLTNVNVFALISTAGLDTPVIISERVDPASESETGVFLKLLRLITYPFADAVVVQTDRIAQSLAARIARLPKVAVIENPVPKGLRGTTHAGSEPDGSRRIVGMGRLSAQKRFDLLIAAFGELAARHVGWNLWIWGEGSLRDALETQVQQLGLSHRVFLPGVTDRPWHELSRADVFALTSDFEGFPNVMLEAMAIGTACVASDCRSGPRELSRNGTSALLVQPGSVSALGAALDRLMTDDDLRQRLGQLARRAAYEQCDIQVVLAKWDRLFGDLA